jgi:Glycosyl transferase family 2
MSKLSPVALFAYNRPVHLARTLAGLAANALAGETDVTVFCDGPKSKDAKAGVDATREVVREARGFRSVRIVERDENLGLARSVIAGVGEVCDSHGRVIVVEDDLVTAPTFLEFMNAALDKYCDESRVGSVHGYWYPVRTRVPETFFLRGASCWGWGTWSRAWRVFDSDGTRLLDGLHTQRLTRAFDLDGAIPYTRMLEAQIAGRNDSWAIRWHASSFLAGLLQLSPGRSLVRNIGFDGSGTHCDDSAEFDVALADSPVRVRDIAVEQSEIARAALIEYYRSTRRGIVQRVVGRVRRTINGLTR